MRTQPIRRSCCGPSTAIRSGWPRQHAVELDHITKLAKLKSTSRLNLDAPDAYEWSLYHLLQNEDVIKNVMFDSTYFRANGDSGKLKVALVRAIRTSVKQTIPAIWTIVRYR